MTLVNLANGSKRRPKPCASIPWLSVFNKSSWYCGDCASHVQVQYALMWAAPQSEQVTDLINKLRSTEHVDKTTKVIAQHQKARVTKEVNNKNMMRLVKIYW